MINKIIAYVESNNNQYAMRFEEAVYFSKNINTKIIQLIQEYNRCSKNTARMIYATSWGKYQIMGYSLYNGICDLRVPVGAFLCNGKIQDMAFLQYCQKNMIDLQAVENEIVSLYQKYIQYIPLEKRGQALHEILDQKNSEFANVIIFVKRYNGAIYPSDRFFNYLLRMIYALEKMQEVKK